ncbi:MAG: acyltransferase [Acidobacteriaceae bacterium]|nr:acyltransferase [Acidobacteriaceae bacterium]
MNVRHTLALPSSQHQIDGLQVVRASAVIVVAWGHAGLPFFTPRTGLLPDLGIFGVDLFFVLSGFILSLGILRSKRSPGMDAAQHFFLRRLIRIYPIYWIFAGVGLLIQAHRHAPYFSHFWASLLLAPFPDYPNLFLVVDFSWTLVFEMFFYLLLAAIQFLTVRRAVVSSIGILCLLVAVGEALPTICKPFAVVVFNPILLEFVLGMLIAVSYKALGAQKMAGRILFCLGVALAIFLRIKLFVTPSMQAILLDKGVFTQVATWGIAAMLVVGGVVFWSPRCDGRVARIAVILGNASYSAYLASGVVILYSTMMLKKVFGASRFDALAPRFPAQVGIVLAILCVGWLCYQFVEWPLLHRMQRWLKRERSASFTEVAECS